jgi:hypothetical protein
LNVPRLRADPTKYASRPIYQTGHARVFGAVGTAEQRVIRFDAVADYLATAVRALRRERVNGALEGIEHMTIALHGHRERLVIIVAANLLRTS